MASELEVVLRNTNELARVSGCKNLEIPAGSPVNEKNESARNYTCVY